MPILHKDTFGPDFPNRALYYPFGPHQRVDAPNPLLAKLEDKQITRPRQTLDIWWRGKQQNGDLMLLLGHLLTLNADWEDSRIRLRMINESVINLEAVTRSMEELVSEVRINASIEVLKRDPSTSIFDQIEQSSSDADIVFMGMNMPEPDDVESYADVLFLSLIHI